MKKKKVETIKSLATHTKDVGSSEVQIGLLTDKILRLSEHFKISTWDFPSRIIFLLIING